MKDIPGEFLVVKMKQGEEQPQRKVRSILDGGVIADDCSDSASDDDTDDDNNEVTVGI